MELVRVHVRSLCLALAVATVAAGCGGSSGAGSTATRALRPSALRELLVGNAAIARAGEVDRYRLSLARLTRVSLDARPVGGLCGRNRNFRWTLTSTAGGRVIVDRPLYVAGFCFDPGPVYLEPGRYVLAIRALHGVTGRYAFTVWRSPEGRFDLRLGDGVGPGRPGRGAGRIDVHGGADAYTFRARAGTSVLVDAREVDGWCGHGETIRWSLWAPGGRRVTADQLLHAQAECHDSEPIRLPVTGRYVLSVYSSWPEWQTGSYAFLLVPVAG